MKNELTEKPIGAGKSSFELVDQEKVFKELNLKKGSTFLDVACGTGAYSVEASHRVGVEGSVIAVDLWEEGIALLKEKLTEKGIKNVKTILGDVSKGLEVEAKSVDVCVIATVLHDFLHAGVADAVLKLVRRVLTPKGVLAIIEFKKIEGPPGPPLRIRLSAEEVNRLVVPYAFRNERVTDVGPYNYLSLFSLIELT